jgi:hypothetical protein
MKTIVTPILETVYMFILAIMVSITGIIIGIGIDTMVVLMLTKVMAMTTVVQVIMI